MIPRAVPRQPLDVDDQLLTLRVPRTSSMSRPRRYSWMSGRRSRPAHAPDGDDHDALFRRSARRRRWPVEPGVDISGVELAFSWRTSKRVPRSSAGPAESAQSSGPKGWMIGLLQGLAGRAQPDLSAPGTVALNATGLLHRERPCTDGVDFVPLAERVALILQRTLEHDSILK